MAQDQHRVRAQPLLTTDTDLEVAGKTLRASFNGASVYPNLVDGFYTLTRQALLSRDPARALKTSRLAFELYPESLGANLAFGLGLIVTGDTAGGQEKLRKASSLNPNGPANAAGLNSIAYQIGSAGMVDEALTILRTAIDLYPKEANLYDSVGEFQLRKGDKVKALEFTKRRWRSIQSFATPQRLAT